MKNRLNWIDSLKGILCLIVFISHFLLAFYPSVHNADISVSHSNFDVLFAHQPLSIFTNGRFCVYVFFVITAFIFSSKFLSDKDNEIVLFKRYIRLVVPVFFVCSITLIIYKFGLFANLECAKITKSWWLESLYVNELNIYNLFTNTFINIPFNGMSLYNTVFWMLKYSFFGIFVVYVLSKIYNNKNISIVYIVLPTAWLIIDNSSYICFVFGYIISYLLNNDILKINNKVLYFVLLLLGIYIGTIPANIKPIGYIINFLLNSGINDYIEVRKLLYEIGAFLIVFSLCKLCTKNKEKHKLKVLPYLGKICFSVYLLHVPIICCLSSSLFIAIQNSINNYNISVAIVFVITLTAVVLLSGLFNKFVENKICKKIESIIMK